MVHVGACWDAGRAKELPAQKLVARQLDPMSIGIEKIERTTATVILNLDRNTALGQFHERQLERRRIHAKRKMMHAEVCLRCGGFPRIPPGDRNVRIARAKHRDFVRPFRGKCQTKNVAIKLHAPSRIGRRDRNVEC